MNQNRGVLNNEMGRKDEVDLINNLLRESLENGLKVREIGAYLVDHDIGSKDRFRLERYEIHPTIEPIGYKEQSSSTE